MANEPDVLKLRILLCFLQTEPNSCTVTGLARTLNEEKYTISRMLTSMERDGWVDRSDSRRPFLTEKGRTAAKRYSERISITLNHLLYEGVDMENARRDAFYWALHCSDKTMEAIRESEERYRVKYELREQKHFGGSVLCRRMRDGSYSLPFLIYREQVKDGNNISMANEGFVHPCTLVIRNGEGFIQMRAVSVSANSGLTGRRMRGKIKSLRYFDNGAFSSAEQNGDIFLFPAAALNFVNIGSGTGQILHGSVCLKMICSVGVVHMPESTAIFTMLV